jgi:peptidoglycan/LPS O-acetylase OafA/YrhL
MNASVLPLPPDPDSRAAAAPAAPPVAAPKSSGVPSPNSTQRWVAIDYLRGIAVLLVCFCHFQRCLPEIIREHVVDLGKTGVQVFFVVSGFIIPYGLFRANYKLSQIGRFHVKRFLRLQPPYLLALGMFFVISAAATLAKHEELQWSWTDILNSAVYRWVPPENPVYWTLLIELKYYVFISVAFSLFFGPRWLAVTCLMLSSLFVHFFYGYSEQIRHCTFFMLGFIAARHALGLSRTFEMAALITLVVVTGLHASTSLQLIVGVCTALLILYMPTFNSRVLAYFGAISYSLYLIHFPIGVKLINLLDSHTPGAVRIFLSLLALGASVAVAEIIFRLAEKPATRWSQGFKLTRKARVAQPTPS